MAEEEVTQYKVVLIGHGYTGKTCLVKQYTEGEFKDTYVATVGSDFISKKLTLKGKTIELNLWTLSGQQCDASTVPSVNFRFANAIIVVFATDNDKSMQVLDTWRLKAEENVHRDTPFFLVANKCDLKTMSDKDLKNIAEQGGYELYFQTSAKTGEGVKKLFESVAEVVSKQTHQHQGFKLGRSKSKVKHSCAC